MRTTEEPLRTTTPARQHAAPRRAANPTRLFVERDRLAWWWFLCALVVLIAAALDRYHLVNAFKQRERVVIIDPAGTFYVSPLLKFDDANELHAQQSTLATVAFLQRNPKDFDNPELLKQMFLKSAHEKAQAQRLSEEAEFKAKQLHQKPEIARIDVPRNARRRSAYPGQRTNHPQWHLPGESLHGGNRVQSEAQAPTQSQHGRERPLPNRS